MKALICFFLRFALGLLPFSIPNFSFVFKWVVTLIYARGLKFFQKGRFDFYDVKAKREPEKAGIIEHPTELKLESPCSDSHLAKAEDKIFFYGVNSKSEFLVVSITRLSHGEAEGCIYLRLLEGKVYRLEKTCDFQQSTGNKRVFSCGGLQMHYLCAMRRWRISYNGCLRETSIDDPSHHRMVYVKFSFLWRASSDVYDTSVDLNEFRVAHSVASVDWNSFIPPVSRLHSFLDTYAQSGVMRGTVNVEDGVQDREMYLFGEKIRYLGDMVYKEGGELSLLLGYVLKNGAFVHVGKYSAPYIAKEIIFGFVVKPNAEINAVEKLKLTEKRHEDGSQEIEGLIDAGHSYTICSSAVRSIHESNNILRYEMNEVEFYLNGAKGVGLYIKKKILKPRTVAVLDIAPQTSIPDLMFPMVILFTEEFCQIHEISGGKGSSLGRLTKLSTELKRFTVPCGMVVTTSAYKEFITRDILQEIRHLEGTLYGKMVGDPKEACERVQEKIISTEIPRNICHHIVKNLKKLFEDGYTQKRFAVRSSATGEDTDQMSAAGQMDTFLGVSGLSNIILALKKCWASQFSFIAVQYKRRYGQCLNSPMAVVIQEMVPCDVAGVLFTCDPVTGNPTKMSIAANFGLGESVVSGSEEPDTIELSRDYKDELQVVSVTVGSKNHKIVLSDTGTDVNDVPEEKRQECCLSNSTALELGKIAVEVEKHYRSKRDIEWGILNDNIHIFQCRPVTSGCQETDFEVQHEMDGPFRVENEFLSVSNVGEVCPGAFSTLGLEISLKLWNLLLQGENISDFQVLVKTRYFAIGWMVESYHFMMVISDVFRGVDPDNMRDIDMALMIGFFGRILDERAIYEASTERYAGEPIESPELIPRIKCFWNRQKILYRTNPLLRNAKKVLDNYRFPIEKYKTARELFNGLLVGICDLFEVFIAHLLCTESSTKWNNSLITTLLKGNKEMVNDVYFDFANLITNRGDVESADVPFAIQTLALHISKSIDPEEFKGMDVEDALLWLQTTNTQAGKSFKEFTARHGHRCLNEMDIYRKPWGTDPRPLVKTLQSYVGTASEGLDIPKNTSNVWKLVSQIKTPLGLLDRLKLLFYVPFAQQAVRNREASKSLFVKCSDVWRKAYRHLAKLMVFEGRMPEEDLLFFMTLEEIKELLEDRSPRVLSKAHHRMRLHPKLDTYVYPEIMQGLPKPINFEEDIVGEEGVFSMKGIPVSQGVTKGYLRVAISLEDAAGLKPGEILLAYSTDIGWSPYFPSLAGVATELGGLISHGAVVSREYGLPCVAGVRGATRRFKTGDYVLLDGYKGILQRLQDPNEMQE